VHGDWIYGGAKRHEKYSVEDIIWTEREIKGYLRGEGTAITYATNKKNQKGLEEQSLGYHRSEILQDGWKYVLYWLDH